MLDEVKKLSVGLDREARERLAQHADGKSPYKAWRGEAPAGEPTLKRDVLSILALAAPAEACVHLRAIPAEDAPVWADGLVTDGEHVAMAQKAETDYGDTYWAVETADGAILWEPTWFIDLACLPAAPTGASKS